MFTSLVRAVRSSGLASPRGAPALLLFLLLWVWTAYLSAPLPYAYLSALFLIPFLLGLVSPFLAVLLLVSLSPLVDGLIAWAWRGSLLAHRNLDILWSEPLFLGVLLGSLVHHIWQRRPAIRLSHGAYFYVAVIVCSTLLSVQALLAEGEYASLSFIRSMWESIPFQKQDSPLYTLRASLLFLSAPTCVWLVRSAVTQPSEVRLVWLSWLGGASLAGLYGLWAWLNHYGYAWPRVEALFDDVNAHGSYQVLTFFIAWAVLVSERSRIVRSLAAILLCLTVLMLLLSGSRIAILATALGLAVVWVPRQRHTMLALLRLLSQFPATLSHLPQMLCIPRKRWAVLGGVAAIVGIMIWTALLAPFEARSTYKYGIQTTVSSVINPYFLVRHFQANRWAVWSASARAFLASPTFGMGPGTLYQRLSLYYRPGDTGWKPAQENAHNYFLHVAAETGILGIIGFVWLIGACVYPLFYEHRSECQQASELNQHSDMPVPHSVPRILAMGAIGYLLTALTGHPLLLSRQLILFWSYLGVLSILPSPPPLSLTPVQTRRRIPLSIQGVLLLFLGMATWGSDAPYCTHPETQTSPVSMRFMTGFYSPEHNQRETWRWLETTGRIHLCSTADTTVNIDLGLRIRSFAHPRQLRVVHNGQQMMDVHIPTHPILLSLPVLALPPGRTTLILSASPEAESVDMLLHNGDTRRISLQVYEPTLSVRP